MDDAEIQRARLDVGDLEARVVRAALERRLFGRATDEPRIGRFVPQSVIGEGATGIVFSAHDPQLERTVALKVIRRANSELQAADVVREARALARVSHSNVVTVYDVRVLDDSVCLVMEKIDGASLRAWLDEGPSTSELLATFAGVGAGLAAIHDAGLMHGDFKPENVLLDAHGEPRVVDFGLARLQRQTPENWLRSEDREDDEDNDPRDGPRLSWAGVGTPLYMAPEQHGDDPPDARADQFALCLFLVEGAVGRHPLADLPFERLADTVGIDALSAVPDADERLDAILPGLSHVIRRGLSPDPADRYPDLHELLRDLQECHTLRRARIRQAAADLEGARAAFIADQRIEARAKLRGATALIDTTLGRSLWWTISKDPLVWRMPLGAAIHRLARSHDGRTLAVSTAAGRLFLVDQRTGLTRVLRGDYYRVVVLAFSPDDTRLATGDENGTVLAWDVQTGRAEPLCSHGSIVAGLAFTPDASCIYVAGSDGRLRGYARTDPPRELRGVGSPLLGLACGPSGALYVLEAGGQVEIRDPDSGDLVRTLGAPSPIATRGDLVLSADGGILAATGPSRGALRIWHIEPSAASESCHRISAHDDWIFSLAITADGRRVISGGEDHRWGVHDTATGAIVTKSDRNTEQVRGVALDDGGRVAYVGARKLELWRLDQGHTSVERTTPEDSAVSVSFDGTGECIVTGYADGRIFGWDRVRGQVVREYDRQDSLLCRVVFESDTRFTVGGYGGMGWTYEAESGRRTRALIGHRAGISDIAILPDARRLATTSWDQTLRIWDESGVELDAFEADTVLLCVASRRDAEVVACAGVGARIWLYDVATRQARELPGPTGAGAIMGLAFSPSGERLAWGDAEIGVHVRDLESGEEWSLSVPNTLMLRVAFHPDGRRVGVGATDGIGRIWDPTSGEVVELPCHHTEIYELAFSPDGRWVATVGNDRTVRLWDADDGRPAWRGAGVLENGRVLTHRGWEPAPSHPPKWMTRAESCWKVVQSGPLVLLAHAAGQVEIWDVDGDRCLHTHELHEVAYAEPTPGGFVVVHRGGVSRVGTDCVVWTRARGVGVAPDPRDDETWVAEADGQATRVDSRGDPIDHVEHLEGACAIVPRAAGLVVGFDDGGVEYLVDRRDPSRRIRFEGTPGLAVVRLVLGPRDLVVGGFADGTLGIWNADDGKRLHARSLHGPVSTVVRRGTRIHALTDLGSSARLDLGIFEMPYEDFLASIEREIPVVWEDGFPVVRDGTP